METANANTTVVAISRICCSRGKITEIRKKKQITRSSPDHEKGKNANTVFQSKGGPICSNRHTSVSLRSVKTEKAAKKQNRHLRKTAFLFCRGFLEGGTKKKALPQFGWIDGTLPGAPSRIKNNSENIKYELCSHIIHPSITQNQYMGHMEALTGGVCVECETKGAPNYWVRGLVMRPLGHAFLLPFLSALQQTSNAIDSSMKSIATSVEDSVENFQQ